MDSGFRQIAPIGCKLHRVPIDSSDTSITVKSNVPGKRINLISSSLTASGAGTVDFNADNTFMMGNVFKAADPAWVLPRNPDAWVVCDEGQTLKIANPDGLTLRGVVIVVLIG